MLLLLFQSTQSLAVALRFLWGVRIVLLVDDLQRGVGNGDEGGGTHKEREEKERTLFICGCSEPSPADESVFTEGSTELVGVTAVGALVAAAESRSRNLSHSGTIIFTSATGKG